MSLQNKGVHLKELLHEQCGGDWGLMGKVLGQWMDEDFMKAKGHRPILCEDWSLLEILNFICEEQGLSPFQVIQNGQLSEAVDVTQFPTLTAVLVEKKLMAAYDAAPKVLDLLVEPFNSNQQLSIIPGAFLKGDLQEVLPGKAYPEDADIESKSVQIAGGKRGLILNITEEAILHDNTGLILRNAGLMGERLRMDREKRGMYTILDATVSGVNYYAYYPETGNATKTYARVAVFSNAVAGGIHSQDNLIDDHLQDFTDLDAAKNRLALMTDDNSESIQNVPKILLVPVSLDTVAGRLIGSSTLPANWNRGVTGSGQGDVNPFQGRYQIVSSSILDTISVRQWYLGDFKKQYVEKIVIPLQVKRAIRGNEDEFKRDIIAKIKVRHWTQVGAVDYRLVVKSNGTYGTCPSASYCSSWT